MTRIRLGRMLATSLAVAMTFAAATHVRADFKSIQAAITKSARIPLAAASATSVSQPKGGSAKKATATVSPSGATFLQLKESLTGHKVATCAGHQARHGSTEHFDAGHSG